MKKLENPKKKASWQYGLGVAKIFAGFWFGVTSTVILLVTLTLWRNRNFLYVGAQFFQLAVITACVFLVYNGFTSCRLSGSYKKLADATEYKSRENIEALAAMLKQSLPRFTRDLQRLERRGFFPEARIDLSRGDWVARPDGLKDRELKDGDTYYEEEMRPSLKPLIALPAVFLGYAVLRPFASWGGVAFAGLLGIAAVCVAIVKTQNITVLKKKTFKLPPAPPPEPINTGDAAMDEFLNASVTSLKELNELSLAITNEKMLIPVGEILSVTRQIFAFVEKHPEKLKQIRQFMNYYLPTTIKLLGSYRDFSREQVKGANITEAMAKIENSMSGIVETFRHELDGLYMDKAVDIAVDIDVMLAMMRQHGIDQKTEKSEG
jgi:hypothetical protein